MSSALRARRVLVLDGVGAAVGDHDTLLATSPLYQELLGQEVRVPVGPVILILIGVVFLLDSLHLIEFRAIGRFWPVLLIIIGAYMLYARVSGRPELPRVPRSPVGAGTGSHDGVVEAVRE